MMPDWHLDAWRGEPAVSLDDGRVSIVVVPGRGGRIVSLRHKAASHEWLLDGVAGKQPASYGASYVGSGLAGWDEMLPTIDPCEYPVEGAHFGVTLPDHGDVWSTSWSFSVDRESLTMWTSGTALPYVFTRTIRAVTPGVLSFQYRLANQSPEDLVYLWAAHPLFARGPGSRLTLPSNVRSVVVVEGDSQTHRRWPDSTLGASTSLDPAVPSAVKFYVPPTVPAAWAVLEDLEVGVSLRLDWDRRLIPYLGVWLDRGRYTAGGVIAIEPTSGYYDDLARAWRIGRASAVRGTDTAEWGLELSIE